MLYDILVLSDLRVYATTFSTYSTYSMQRVHPTYKQSFIEKTPKKEKNAKSSIISVVHAAQAYI